MTRDAALLPTLIGARVLELEGDDSVAYAGRLLAATGATVVVLETGAVEPTEDARRSFLHAGKLSVALADGDSGAAELARKLAECADVVLGSDEEPGVDGPEPWRTALLGASLAVSAAAQILGMPAEPLADFGATLTNGTLFPIPGPQTGGAAQVAGDGSARLLRAHDGWVVTGPSALGSDALAGLVRAEGAASLEAWVEARSREEACTTLQQWRTGYAPVLELAEAATLDPVGPGQRDVPRPGEHTKRVLKLWLGLADDAVDGLVAAGVISA